MNFPINAADLFAGGVPGAVAALVGLTGVLAGAGRYVAVLAGHTGPDLERSTALGFFFGLLVWCIVCIVEFAI